MPGKKPDYCPYKEHWFGPGEEAQAKPAACKFKRGSLIRVRPHYLGGGYATPETGREFDLSPELRRIDENSVMMLLMYDSSLVQKRVWNEKDGKYQYVEATEHLFTFLWGEKMGTLTLTVWGQWYRDVHNEMWRKAHKPRKPPQKKPKKRAKGFSFDNYE